jgi:hypothetical protein
MYVKSQDLEKWCAGSLEDRIDRVEAAIARTVGSPVEVVATREDCALFRDRTGRIVEAVFAVRDGRVEDVEVRNDPVPVYEDVRLPQLVADELRDVTSGLLHGDPMTRTRVRALALLLRQDEDYWLSDVLSRLNEALQVDESVPGHWHTAYQANQERIRTSLWGSIRDLEARIPKTAYARLPSGRLPEFADELRESLGIVSTRLKEIVDGISRVVFDGDDGLYGAIRESLIAEAQLLRGLLAKAEQLMRADDLHRMAEAHDRLCGRAKTMEVVAAYLTGRPKKGAEETK